MSTTPEEILNLFVSFQEGFDAEQQIREKIREVAIELEHLVRRMMTVLQGIHLESSIKDYPQILSKANEMVPTCGELFKKLGICVPGKDYYKYHDHWRNTTQKAVFCIALIVYLETSKLASKEDIASRLSLKDSQSEGFHLDLEDYLHGLLQLVSELSRFAVNSAAAGDFDRPVSISKFVNEVNAGFSLIKFKNDSLRKHYDCFKYDLKKIEEVVYDISIRGLKSSSQTD